MCKKEKKRAQYNLSIFIIIKSGFIGSKVCQLLLHLHTFPNPGVKTVCKKIGHKQAGDQLLYAHSLDLFMRYLTFLYLDAEFYKSVVYWPLYSHCCVITI